MTDLVNSFFTDSMNEVISTMVAAFKLKYANYADQAMRIDEWATTLLLVRENRLPADEADKAARAVELDNYRRQWVNFYRRFQILCTVGKVPAQIWHDVEFPGPSRIITFLQVRTHIIQTSNIIAYVIFERVERTWPLTIAASTHSARAGSHSVFDTDRGASG